MSDASAKTSRREIRRAFGGAAIDTLNTHDAQLAALTRLLQHAIARLDQQDSQLRELQRELRALVGRLDAVNSRFIECRLLSLMGKMRGIYTRLFTLRRL